MSTTLEPETNELVDELPPFPVRRWSLKEYHDLIEQGIFDDERVELLEGWIARKMTRNPLHESTLPRVVQALQPSLGPSMHLRIQAAVTAARSEPEPDVSIVKGETGDYRRRHPGENEVLHIIEVADSSLRKDRAKTSIYASLNVPACWIVNVQQEQVEVYVCPDQGRRYREKRIYRRGDTIPLRLESAEHFVLVDSLLLPPEK